MTRRAQALSFAFTGNSHHQWAGDEWSISDFLDGEQQKCTGKSNFAMANFYNHFAVIYTLSFDFLSHTRIRLALSMRTPK